MQAIKTMPRTPIKTLEHQHYSTSNFIIKSAPLMAGQATAGPGDLALARENI